MTDKKQTKEPIKLILGIGNPGSKYENTYHNAGVDFAQYIAKKLAEDVDIDWKQDKFFDFFKPEMGPIIAISNTFMNDSGTAFKAALKKFNLQPGEIAVAQDESDIELGKWKLSYDSRSAGHRGIESIIEKVGTKEFWRIRLGVRKLKGKALDFVLKKTKKEDAVELERSFEEISKILL